MPRASVLPDVAQLLRHVAQDMTHEEIGKLYGTSRQAVSAKLAGAVEGRPQRRSWPWDVQTRHKKGWLYLALSYYTISRTKERQLRPKEVQALSGFMDMMDEHSGYVVDYFPDTDLGFQLRPRIEGHDDPDSHIGVPRGVARTA